MTGPSYVYDMTDMEETDYRAEFNAMWQQWRGCKAQRDALLEAYRRTEQTIRNLVTGGVGPDDRLILSNELRNIQAVIAKAEEGQMKYVPAPWEFRSDGLYSGEFPILWVTQGHSGELYLGANEDDTHLIAAAPDLLKACRRAAYVYDNWADLSATEIDAMIDELRAAIAKARGGGQ
jgi:hypothetical protein